MPTPESEDAVARTVAARDRVKYLLAHHWRGNQREMARALSVSQGLISKVVNGQQNPGRRLLAALAARPEINAEWVRSGVGQPVPFPEDGSLPVVAGVLPGPPLRFPQLLTGTRHPVARGLDRPTRYWHQIGSRSPLVRDPSQRLVPGDLLLMETAADWVGRSDMTMGRLCGVRFPGYPEPFHELGLVIASPGGLLARLFSGSFVPPLPEPTTRRKRKPDVELRRKVRLLENEEQKAERRKQAEAAARKAAEEGLTIQQDDIVAVQVYMVRPELSFGAHTA